jgi:hypothetical protein
MKRLSNTQTKKRAASRPPVWVASSDHVLPPPSVLQRTTSLPVIRIKLAMPIRRVTNLPYHYQSTRYGFVVKHRGHTAVIARGAL